MNFWRDFYIICFVIYTVSGLDIPLRDDIVLSLEPVPVTFTAPDAFLRFQPWNFAKYSILEIQFHTREPTGVLFFVGSSSSSQDCVGLEVFNSNLFGFGKLMGNDFRIQLNPPEISVSTGKFHKVSIQLDPTNNLLMKFDNLGTSNPIAAPGRLEFESYTYIGGIDTIHRLPWKAYSHNGFTGCVNYVRVNNDKFVDMKKHAKQEEFQGAQTGSCHTTVARCLPGICGPGQCYERSYNLLNHMKNFYCDCSGTFKSYSTSAVDILRGESCIIDAPKFECNSKSYMLYTFVVEKKTHFDDISLDFKTSGLKEPLFVMKSKTTEILTTYIKAEIISGQTIVNIKLFDSNNPYFLATLFSKQSNLNDGQWHTFKLKRYAENVELYVDDKKEVSKVELHRSKNQENFFNHVKEIYLGSVTRPPNRDKCTGEFKNFYWNEEDLLGRKNVFDKYQSEIVTDKPVLPVLPPFPRQPPIPCSVKASHSYTILGNLPMSRGGITLMVEFKTKYNGILLHGTQAFWSRTWITIVIHLNSIVVAYNVANNRGVDIIEVTRGGLTLKDNMWHRIVAELNIQKESLFIHIDDVESLTKEIHMPNSKSDLSGMSYISFSLGGISIDNQQQELNSLLLDKAPDVSKSFVDSNDYKFVGCLGEALTSKDNFTSNLLRKPDTTSSPENGLVCRACQVDLAKCPQNYCQNNGKCYNYNDNVIACNCKATGFYGKYCDTKIPSCKPDPCKNGFCQIVENNQICNCSGTGYTGFNCETSLCTNYKCLNNGICRLKNGRPECDCVKTGYEGINCEIPKCIPDFCKNNGQCLLDQVTQLPYCICKGTGYTGFSCDKPICSPNYCNNNGKCYVREDKPICYCREGKEGERCEKSVCPNDQCLNGGTCKVKNNIAVCTCLPEFVGERCEKCNPNYCFNGGQCEIINTFPYCNCSATSYVGKRCETPKKCPDKYCENNGKCSIVGYNFACDCSGTGFSGERCSNKVGCPAGYCKNDGVCQVTGDKFTCDCSLTPYTGPRCDEKANGILCDYRYPGYAITPFNPLMVSHGVKTSMGFQTYIKTGTLFCYETADDKYWLVKLVGGKPVVDINGQIFGMKTVVNDGKYHIISVSRDAVNFLVTLDNPIVDTLVIPTLITSILTLPNNVIVYSKLTLCNSCPDTRNKDRFQGAIGNARSGDQDISTGIKNGQAAMIGGVQNQLTPVYPLPPVPKIIPCTPGYCSNGGNCSVKNYGPFCNCGFSGFTGDRCEMKIFVLRSVPPTPGYVVVNSDPVVPSNFDLMGFIFQLSEANSPLIALVTQEGNYVEIKVENDIIQMKSNGVFKGQLNMKPLERNTTHFLKVVNLLGRMTVYINGTRLGHITLKEPTLMANSSIRISKLLIGANNKMDETIKGFLGDFQHNNYKLFGPNGSIIVPAASIPNVKIEALKGFGRKMPEIKQQFKGSHGGAVFGTFHFVVAEGFGGGAIVEISGGPIILGALFFNAQAIGVNPLVLGLILAFLLLIIALIWAVFNLICARGHLAGGAVEHPPLLNATSVTYKSGAFGNASFMKNDFSTEFNSTLLQSNFIPEYSTMNNNAYMGHGITNMGTFKSTKAETDLSASPPRYQRLEQNMVNNNASLLSANNTTLLSQAADNDFEKIQPIKYANAFEQNDTDFRNLNVFSNDELKLDCCALTSNSKFAITGSINGPPQIWDLNDGSLIHIMDGSNQACTSLNLAMNDSILIGLITQNQQPMSLKMPMMWNFPGGQIMDFQSDFSCTTCCVSSDGKYLVIADDPKESSVTICNLTNGMKQTEHFKKPETMNADGIQFLKISKNFSNIIAGYRTVDNMSCYMVFTASRNRFQEASTFKSISNLNSCEFVNNNDAVTGTESGELLIWNLQTAQVIKNILVAATTTNGIELSLNPHEASIQCLVVSTDGSILATGSTDSSVKVWFLGSGKLMHSFQKHTDEVHSLAMSNDNEILVSGSLDGSIRVWNIMNGMEMCCFTSNIEINKVLLSHDKKVIVGLGERATVNKLVMMKLLRNVTQVTRNMNSDNTLEEFISPPL